MWSFDGDNGSTWDPEAIRGYAHSPAGRARTKIWRASSGEWTLEEIDDWDWRRVRYYTMRLTGLEYKEAKEEHRAQQEQMDGDVPTDGDTAPVDTSDAPDGVDPDVWRAVQRQQQGSDHSFVDVEHLRRFT